MTDPRAGAKGAAAGLLKALNEHGHAFAASVLALANDTEMSFGTWALRASEFGGELRGRAFHIDGVLQCQLAENRVHNDMILAAVECKRADPAVARWCFIGSSVVRGDRLQRSRIFDRYTLTPAPHFGSPVGATAVQSYLTKGRIYQLGMELKTHDTGSGTGRSLNDALTQVCRGASGLVSRLPEWMSAGQAARVVPIIATTAQLLVSDQDIAGADVATGDLPTDHLQTREVPWLWYETHLTPDLSPDAQRSLNAQTTLDPVGYALDHQQARAVMITRGTAIREALQEVASALFGADPVRG